ncbi:MAG: signal recognition particle-docking protein FtsY [Planctomycetota bacterium]
MAFFAKTLDRLKGALNKTAAVLNTDVRTLFVPGRQIDHAFLDELEEKLIIADTGVKRAMTIREAVQDRWRLGKIKNAEEAADIVKSEMLQGWSDAATREIRYAESGPTVIMVCGVNGAGKTTSIAKLAWLLKEQAGKRVMLAAGDTFRAAAVEQLTLWAERLGIEIVKQRQGVDPAAVAYDACEAAVARGVDVLIVDTAGRLHTQQGLMRELGKIRSVIAKKIDGAPHETILVLDATTGQNAISQAKHFNREVDVTGLFLSKLDGSAKGGVVVAIRDELQLPVKFIGLGETPQDVETFDPDRFVEALFERAARGSSTNSAVSDNLGLPLGRPNVSTSPRTAVPSACPLRIARARPGQGFAGRHPQATQPLDGGEESSPADAVLHPGVEGPWQPGRRLTRRDVQPDGGEVRDRI